MPGCLRGRSVRELRGCWWLAVGFRYARRWFWGVRAAHDVMRHSSWCGRQGDAYGFGQGP